MPIGPAKRSWTRTLRFRLMVWNALVVVVTAFVILAGLREGVRITLIRELDQVLAEDASEIGLALSKYKSAESALLREQLDRKDTGRAQHKWFAQLIDGEGRVLFATSHAPGLQPFAEPRTVGEWRVAQRQQRSLPDITVIVGASLAMIHADVARLDKLVAAAAATALVIAPLCGYWLAGRATRPLNQMIGTMSQLRPANLHERLEIRGTGDELDRLSITFNGLLDRIGTYLQERRDFLANSAHELRTPLAAIRSSIEVTLTKSRSSQDYEELLAEVIEESASLELLVNQLLLLSETEAERLRIHTEHVRLDVLIEKALDMFGGVAEFREIQLLCPALPAAEIRGNRQHLRQVIHNLLDNALKFTPAGGRVCVQLALDEAHVVVEVTDSGAGIPAEDLPQIFDRFYRGDRARQGHSDVRGTGLGLSICKAIVRAHEGTITVDSQLGRGTRFTVRLPRVLASEDAPANEPQPEWNTAWNPVVPQISPATGE